MVSIEVRVRHSSHVRRERRFRIDFMVGLGLRHTKALSSAESTVHSSIGNSAGFSEVMRHYRNSSLHEMLPRLRELHALTNPSPVVRIHATLSLPYNLSLWKLYILWHETTFLQHAHEVDLLDDTLFVSAIHSLCFIRDTL